METNGKLLVICTVSCDKTIIRTTNLEEVRFKP